SFSARFVLIPDSPLLPAPRRARPPPWVPRPRDTCGTTFRCGPAVTCRCAWRDVRRQRQTARRHPGHRRPRPLPPPTTPRILATPQVPLKSKTRPGPAAAEAPEVETLGRRPHAAGKESGGILPPRTAVLAVVRAGEHRGHE